MSQLVKLLTLDFAMDDDLMFMKSSYLTAMFCAWNLVNILSPSSSALPSFNCTLSLYKNIKNKNICAIKPQKDMDDH